MGMRSTHLSRCPAPHAHARAAHESPGDMAAQLNVTFCDMPCSWLTRTAPPLWRQVPVSGHIVRAAPERSICRVDRADARLDQSDSFAGCGTFVFREASKGGQARRRLPGHGVASMKGRSAAGVFRCWVRWLAAYHARVSPGTVRRAGVWRVRLVLGLHSAGELYRSETAGPAGRRHGGRLRARPG